MSENKESQNDGLNSESKEKKKYIKPEVISEEIMAYGAVCNGQSRGGRKASVGAPDFCNTNRLQS